MSVSNTDFILVQFNQTITLDISASFDTSYVEIGAYDAMCEVDICLNEWADCFKITSDSEDINDVDASDITYYVYNTSNAAGIKGISAMNNKASLAGGSNLKDGNPSTATVSNTPIDSNATLNSLEYDFIRHISYNLFNTPNGVDLFNNETALRLSVETACNDLLDNLEQTLIDADTLYSSGSNDITNTNNLTYTLLNQLLNKQGSRFVDYAISSTVPTKLPWADGDKIWYLLTVDAAPNQHLLVRNSGAVASRVYLVKMNLKA
jgi:hypothetical protein